LIKQNGAAVSFFLHLARVTNDAKCRAAARHGLTAFSSEFAQFGVHAAPFGRALGEFLSLR
jgi:uncharacterized protein YyaL (SSP411 family)